MNRTHSIRLANAAVTFLYVPFTGRWRCWYYGAGVAGARVFVDAVYPGSARAVPITIKMSFKVSTLYKYRVPYNHTLD